MADTRRRIKIQVGAALECAEDATRTTNDLVAHTPEAAVTAKEVATTMHHAYSAQVHVAMVFEWSKDWARSQKLVWSNPSTRSDCLTWMRRARGHADKLCRCFPMSEDPGGKAPSIAHWAERWPQDYLEAKSRAEKSLEKIESAIDAIQREQQIEGSIALEMYTECSA